jgi:hypothetical protein
LRPQRSPQPPQFSGSKLTSVQSVNDGSNGAGHSCVKSGQPHSPSLQKAPSSSQRSPQPPQFSGSNRMLVQRSVALSSPKAQRSGAKSRQRHCHLTETGTGFVHVAERLPDQPSPLSFFLQSELQFRSVFFEAILNGP